jgi:hypothetical protein
MIKVRFELDQSDWHGHGSETLWASPIVETEWRNFRIMNSPLFANGISNRDIVKASAFDNDFRTIDYYVSTASSTTISARSCARCRRKKTRSKGRSNSLQGQQRSAKATVTI